MGSLYFLRAARKKECHSQMKIVRLHREVKYIHKPYYSSKHLTVGQPALIIKPKKKKNGGEKATLSISGPIQLIRNHVRSSLLVINLKDLSTFFKYF